MESNVKRTIHIHYFVQEIKTKHFINFLNEYNYANFCVFAKRKPFDVWHLHTSARTHLCTHNKSWSVNICCGTFCSFHFNSCLLQLMCGHYKHLTPPKYRVRDMQRLLTRLDQVGRAASSQWVSNYSEPHIWFKSIQLHTHTHAQTARHPLF